MSGIAIRTCVETDVTQYIMPISIAAYGEQFYETEDAFLSKIRATPGSCFIAYDSSTGRVVGYLVGVHASSSQFPKLNQQTYEAPSPAEFYYLHDICTVQDRVKGVGALLMNTAKQYAKSQGFKKIVEISVNNSEAFARSHGCVRADPDAYGLREHLRSFGEDAILMEIDLTKE